MDYRRSLFQLEQWSPSLARKVWGLTSFLDSSLAVALGLKVTNLSDVNIEVEVPVTRLNKNELGQVRAASLIGAGEFACKTLWHRHINSQNVQMTLTSLQYNLIKPALETVKVRTEMVEGDREKILRKIHLGEEANSEMSVGYFDKKDQQLAGMNCVWHLRSMGLATLQQGKNREF